jgi:hypothetical protein
MIDITDFGVPTVDDPDEQARLLAQAEAELEATLSEEIDSNGNITNL